MNISLRHKAVLFNQVKKIGMLNNDTSSAVGDENNNFYGAQNVQKILGK